MLHPNRQENEQMQGEESLAGQTTSDKAQKGGIWEVKQRPGTYEDFTRTAEARRDQKLNCLKSGKGCKMQQEGLLGLLWAY